ncbi:hypothetical protein NQZ68_033753 [Dissostichus eleginoides]|nr:hypothetical protein NQZ68_033753 [Dissostichus eleginoides]
MNGLKILSEQLSGLRRLLTPVQVLPKAPTGRRHGETGVKQHFAEQTRPGECEHQRSTTWTFHSFSNVILASLSCSLCAVHSSHTHTDICQIGIYAHTHIHTQQGAASDPLLASSNAEGEKRDQFEQRGKR